MSTRQQLHSFLMCMPFNVILDIKFLLVIWWSMSSILNHSQDIGDFQSTSSGQNTVSNAWEHHRTGSNITIRLQIQTFCWSCLEFGSYFRPFLRYSRNSCKLQSICSRPPLFLGGLGVWILNDFWLESDPSKNCFHTPNCVFHGVVCAYLANDPTCAQIREKN